tara:strand:- start:618 stop:905 length:288 start_codon:yes stop_codon:yes gene_type:complete
MSASTPIYSIAKELNIDSNKIILACKTLGIFAKGSAKRLNKEELEKVKSFFETGKNVSHETIDLKVSEVKTKNKSKTIKEERKIIYFKNRLIRKS